MRLLEPATERPLGSLGSWQTTLLIGLVTLLLGLIVAFHPSASLNVIAVLLGVLMIVTGLFHLVRMFSSAESHRVWLGVSGLLFVVLGVILIRHPDFTVTVIGLTVGIGWIIQGLSALALGFSGDAEGGRGLWIILGIISLIGGIVITAVPVKSITAIAVLIGIWFIVLGLFEIFDGFLLRHMIKKSQLTIVNPPRKDEGAATLLTFRRGSSHPHGVRHRR
jgi:uncharacterized membrane protein HdeD (DUF308 family)